MKRQKKAINNNPLRSSGLRKRGVKTAAKGQRNNDRSGYKRNANDTSSYRPKTASSRKKIGRAKSQRDVKKTRNFTTTTTNTNHKKTKTSTNHHNHNHQRTDKKSHQNSELRSTQTQTTPINSNQKKGAQGAQPITKNINETPRQTLTSIDGGRPDNLTTPDQKEELVSLLLEERGDLLEQVDNRDKMIDSFKEEIRKIKTLSQYYPDNKDLILEEGEGSLKGRDSLDGDGEIFIVSTNSLNLENEKPKSLGLRGSYDHRSDRKSLLRQSNYIPSNTPRKAEELFRGSVRTPSPDNLTYNNAKSMDMDSAKGIGFNKPLINIQTNLSELRVSNLSAPDFSQTPRGPNSGVNLTPFPTLLDNFMRYLKSKNDDETYKFAEYTFLQIEKIFEEKERVVSKLKQKNFTLVSVLADYKEKEKNMTAQELKNQITLDSHEKKEKRKRLEKIKIPDNLKRFKDEVKPFNFTAGQNPKDHKPEEPQQLSERDEQLKMISINQPNIQNHTTVNTGPQTQYFNVSINPYGNQPPQPAKNHRFPPQHPENQNQQISDKNKFSYFFVKKNSQVKI